MKFVSAKVDGKTAPLVSVVLCTFDGGEFISEQLGSIISQTYQRLELVIIDDNSTDETFIKISSILSSKSDRFERVVLKQNEANLGYSENFQKAISYAEGDFIALSDQDDVWNIDKVEILVSQVEDNILIYHDSKLIDSSGIPLNIKMSEIHSMYDGDDVLPFLLFNCVSGHSCMFSQRLLDCISGVPDGAYLDHWLAFSAINFGRIKYLGKTLVSYRIHGNNYTSIDQSSKKITQREKQIAEFRIKEKAILERVRFIKAILMSPNLRERELITKLHRLLENHLSANVNFCLLWFVVRYKKRLFKLRMPKNAYSSESNRNYIMQNFLFGLGWHR